MKKFNKELITQPNTVVQCKTEKQAKQLLKWADSQGWKWHNDDSYLEDNGWHLYGSKACYDVVGGILDSRSSYRTDNYTILSFKDVMFKPIIAVRVKTQQQWDRASEVMGHKWNFGEWDIFGELSCIELNKKLYDSVSWYEEFGHKVISYKKWKKMYDPVKWETVN